MKYAMPLIESRISKLQKNEDKMTVNTFDKKKFEEEQERERNLAESQSAMDMAGQIKNITYTDLSTESNQDED